jgi:SAM-dependent methyltransferase
MGFFAQSQNQTGTDPVLRVEWEEPNCLLCGGDHWCPLVEAPDNTEGGGGLWFAVVQCQKCGLCFTNPRPTEATIGRFYPPTYKPHRKSSSRQSGTLAARMKRWVGWRESERKTFPVEGKGRLLDFGCGGGSYLARMHHQGWQVTGLDISPDAVRRVRDELHLPALVGSLPCWELASGSFDVITMWQVLEHVHAPLEVLQDAHRLLAPGGKLVVSVPNIDSLPFRLFGSCWLSLDLPRHLTHFTPNTLHLMLERAGFRIWPIRMVRHSQWLRRSAVLACRQKRVRPWQRWLRAKPPSRVTTWYGYLTQQSDCMVVTAER